MKNFFKDHPFASILIVDSICSTIKYIVHEIKLSVADEKTGSKPYFSYVEAYGMHNRSVFNRAATGVLNAVDGIFYKDKTEDKNE